MKNIYERIVIDRDNILSITSSYCDSATIISINDIDVTTTLIKNNKEISSTVPFSKGDIIELYTENADIKNILAHNPFGSNSLFGKHSASTKFKYNHIYEAAIKTKDNEFDTSFTTKYDPMYSNVKKIRLDTGDLLVNVTDSQIEKAIYLNSKEVVEILDPSGNKNANIMDSMVNYIKQYVRYKTDLDFLQAIYLSITGKYGSINKKIGDIDIQKEVSIPYVSDMMDYFKKMLAPYEEQLKSGDAHASSFVKATSGSGIARGTF